jgi:hypothetical protein
MKFFLMLSLMMGFTANALACSCGAWDAQAVMDNADGVYIAIPLEDSTPAITRWPRPIPRPRPILGLHKTNMKIVKTYKGTETDELRIYHDAQIGTSCEMNFQQMSGVFVIITYKYLGKQVTDACSASAISPNNSMVTNFLSQL